jgi:hypothetical protein
MYSYHCILKDICPLKCRKKNECSSEGYDSFPFNVYGKAPPIARVYIRCHGGQETIFEYEIDREVTGIETLISSHHYLKIVGNNKL